MTLHILASRQRAGGTGTPASGEAPARTSPSAHAGRRACRVREVSSRGRLTHRARVCAEFSPIILGKATKLKV